MRRKRGAKNTAKAGPHDIPADLWTLQAGATEAPPFRSIGTRFVIKEALGEGGMAVVYSARDRQRRQDVAVKILKPALLKDQDSLARFELEVHAHQISNHPHLVQFIESGVEKGLPYLVMELVAGPSLKTWVSKRGPLAPDLAMTLFAQVARGLGAMHRQAVLHRDVKPQNVLLGLRNGEPRVAKLSDLGLARVKTIRRLTRGGDFVGTAAYMAPEQIVQDPLDERADLYGLGASLFLALTGEVLFEGPAADVFLQHLYEPPPIAKEKRPELPDAVVDVLHILLRKHPDNRYRNALAAAADMIKVERGARRRGVALSVEPDNYTPASADGREAWNVFADLRKKRIAQRKARAAAKSAKPATPSSSKASRPTASKPAASKPAANKPAASKPRSGKPKSSKPKSSKPKSSKPKSSKPKATASKPRTKPPLPSRARSSSAKKSETRSKSTGRIKKAPATGTKR